MEMRVKEVGERRERELATRDPLLAERARNFQGKATSPTQEVGARQLP